MFTDGHVVAVSNLHAKQCVTARKISNSVPKFEEKAIIVCIMYIDRVALGS